MTSQSELVTIGTFTTTQSWIPTKPRLELGSDFLPSNQGWVPAAATKVNMKCHSQPIYFHNLMFMSEAGYSVGNKVEWDFYPLRTDWIVKRGRYLTEWSQEVHVDFKVSRYKKIEYKRSINIYIHIACIIILQVDFLIIFSPGTFHQFQTTSILRTTINFGFNHF